MCACAHVSLISTRIHRRHPKGASTRLNPACKRFFIGSFASSTSLLEVSRLSNAPNGAISLVSATHPRHLLRTYFFRTTHLYVFIWRKKINGVKQRFAIVFCVYIYFLCKRGTTYICAIPYEPYILS